MKNELFELCISYQITFSASTLYMTDAFLHKCAYNFLFLFLCTKELFITQVVFTIQAG